MHSLVDLSAERFIFISPVRWVQPTSVLSSCGRLPEVQIRSCGDMIAKSESSVSPHFHVVVRSKLESPARELQKGCHTHEMFKYS